MLSQGESNPSLDGLVRPIRSVTASPAAISRLSSRKPTAVLKTITATLTQAARKPWRPACVRVPRRLAARIRTPTITISHWRSPKPGSPIPSRSAPSPRRSRPRATARTAQRKILPRLKGVAMRATLPQVTPGLPLGSWTPRKAPIMGTEVLYEQDETDVYAGVQGRGGADGDRRRSPAGPGGSGFGTGCEASSPVAGGPRAGGSRQGVSRQGPPEA